MFAIGADFKLNQKIIIYSIENCKEMMRIVKFDSFLLEIQNLFTKAFLEFSRLSNSFWWRRMSQERRIRVSVSSELLLWTNA